MGDHHAPDLAQQAHVNVLRRGGLMKDSERFEYRRLFPPSKSDFVEGLMMDDRVGVMLMDKLKWRQQVRAQDTRDVEAFRI